MPVTNDQIYESLQGLSSQVSNVGVDMAAVKEKVSSLDRRVDALNARVEEKYVTKEVHSARSELIDLRNTTIEKKIDNLHHNLVWSVRGVLSAVGAAIVSAVIAFLKIGG